MEKKTLSKGTIVSADLTVEDAENIRDFYKAVIGWDVEEMPLKDGIEQYSDYIMKDADGNWAGGVCHHRGVNAGIPPQWIVYINVENIGASIQQCIELGGSVVKESKDSVGKYHYAIIRDPSGAVLGLTTA
ncbi:MAG TPA: VOC family protein [Pseudosphingobacterium sp.]|nr:VOC family protein [Pseudosphingobacterium sp.]